MKTIRAFFIRIFGLLPGTSRDRDLTEEIEANLQLHIDDNLRQGMTSQQARRQALLKLGGLEPAKEAYRDQATLPLLENALRDIRFAVRQLRKNKGFAFTAILMLALGMCASLAIFAFVDATLVQPLPYKNPNRLVGVYEKLEKVCPLCNLSYPDYLDWKQQNTVFSSFDAYNHQGMMRPTPSGPKIAFGTRVTAGFFQTLGVTPILGRDFRPGEDQVSAPRTALLSYSAWQKDYAGDPKILGTSVTLNGDPTIIIGVLPPAFYFAPSEPTDYWVAMHASSECDLRRSCHGLFGVARLKDGVTTQSALADVTGIASRLEKLYPGSNKEQGANVSPLSEVIFGTIRPILLVLLAGAFLLLLIAAVNVASLLLVRTESRTREFAIRSGLGASSARITGQFITEGLLLVAVGTLLGLAAAFWAIQLLLKLLSQDMLLSMPYLKTVGLNAHVLACAGVIAALSALVFSFTPAVSLSLADIRQGISEGTRGSSGNTWRRLGSKLVVIELATAVVLLAGAGLLGQSLYRLLTVKIGMQPDHLALISFAVPPNRYSDDTKLIGLERKIITAASQLPGVKSAGISTKSPVTFSGNTTWFKIIGKPWHGEHNDTPVVDVTPGYFQTLGATLLRGRYFTESDDSSKPLVAIVNESFAKQYFPNEDAVGRQISPLGDHAKPIQIVGVLGDIKEAALDSETRPTLYYPFNQDNDNYLTLFARVTGSESATPSSLAEAIRRIDPDILTVAGQTMTQQIDSSQAAYLHRSLAWLVGGFAALALILAVVGLYGVIAYSVAQRTREIGIRVALGAERTGVYKLILKDAGGLIAFGSVLGITCAVAASSLIRKMLFGVSSWDVPTFAAVTVLLAASALFASFIPARRAASVNPVEALRTE